MNTYSELWKQKLLTAQEIAAQVQPGWVCCTDSALGTPYSLLQTIGVHLKENNLRDVQIYTVLDIRPLSCYQEDISPYFHGISWFSGKSAKKAVNQGLGDILPCYYRDMPELFRSRPQMDAVFLEVDRVL